MLSKIKNEGNSYRHNDIKNMYLKSHKRVKNINLCSFENKEQNRDVIIKFMTLTFRTLYMNYRIMLVVCFSPQILQHAQKVLICLKTHCSLADIFVDGVSRYSFSVVV